jgi:hypothetical protein
MFHQNCVIALFHKALLQWHDALLAIAKTMAVIWTHAHDVMIADIQYNKLDQELQEYRYLYLDRLKQLNKYQPKTITILKES